VEISILILFIAGALGSLTKDILEDNELKLPKKTNDNFSLGFLGGMITGGIAGYFVDGSPTTAFLAGYAGTGVIENLLSKKEEQNNSGTGLNEAIIRKVAVQEGVDPDLAVRVAKCESNLNEKAKHVNADGSVDRGLYQINSKYHPEISDEEAFNPIFATEFFCKAFKSGNLSWWNPTRKCWEK
jgi:hypothetical protein